MPTRLPVDVVLASLTPESWYLGMPTWGLLAITAVTMAIVIKGADWLVEGAAGVAKRLGMPEVVVGATIVSLGTTSPEAAVSVLAAFNGDAGLAIGNGVGSIIADTGLIFGMGCLLASLPADRFVLSRQGWVQVGSAVLLSTLCYILWITQGQTATLDRWVGVVLVVLLVGYMAISIRWARQHPAGEPHTIAEADGTVHCDRESHAAHTMTLLILMGLGGLLLVVGSGDALVNSVKEVAVRWNVPDAVIASTIVALGTSLPELVTGITAIRKGHPELLVGNVIGADILNVLFVIGVSALAAPLPLIDPSANMPAVILQVMLPAMLIMLVFMRLCIFKASRAGHFSRWMGAPLVAMYVGYLVVSYLTSV